MCFLYYCRIKEVLNATIGDVLSCDRLVVRGVKGSNSYVIYLPGLCRGIDDTPGTQDSDAIFPCSYISLYRASIKAGIRHVDPNKKNSKRLHASRYKMVSELSQIVPDSHLSGILRHKSAVNYVFYKPTKEAKHG